MDVMPPTAAAPPPPRPTRGAGASRRRPAGRGRAVALALWLLLLAVGAARVGAQGTVTLSPAFPARGTQATVTYVATGGPLAAATTLRVGLGFNGFATSSEVAMSGARPTWTHTFPVPATATSIDFYFTNGSGTYDNNGGTGIDWQFVVAEAQALPRGAARVAANLGGGWLFSTWAPNASRIAVRGSFNSFTDRRDDMRRDPATGIWYAHVPGATAGQEYKYYLNGTTWRKDPRARRQVSSTGNSILYDPAAFSWGATPVPPLGDPRGIVLYELHVGTFDRTGTGGGVGTFGAILASGRLDHLAELGVNLIHVMPVFEFPGDVSGGYNLSDPFAIEAAYGGPDGLKQFVAAAHARGLGVLMDVVYNHFGPNDLDLYNFDGAGGPGIYFYDTPLALAETPFGPRPDFAEEQVRAYIRDNTRMLWDEYRMSGLRWDFTKAIRGTVDGSFNVTAPIPEGISLMREINGESETHPGRFLIAEDLAGDASLTTPTSDPAGFGFDAQWDGSFEGIVRGALTSPTVSDAALAQVAGQVTGDFERLYYIESHDTVWAVNGKKRLPVNLDPATPASLFARRRAALAASLLLTTPGVPMLFMGQELLDIGGPDGNGAWDEGEGLDWSRLAQPAVAGILALYRDLVAARRNLGGTTAGLLGDTTNLFFSNVNGTKVLAWERSNGGSAPGDRVIVLANFNDFAWPQGFEIGFPQPGPWHEVFNSGATTYGADFGGVGAGQVVTTSANPLHGYPHRGAVSVGPMALVILSRAEPAGATPAGVVVR